jgi:Peptidase A4 family
MPIKQSDGSYTDRSWSGAAIGANAPWNAVIATWTIPTVSQPSGLPGTSGLGWASSSWVGIDGYDGFSYDVLQVGVIQSVDLNGSPSYTPFVEWYVLAPTDLPAGTPVDGNGYPPAWVNSVDGMYQYIYPAPLMNFPVTAGQEVICSAQYTSNNTAGTLIFANVTTGQHTQVTLPAPPGTNFHANSVEWIMEAPGGGEPYSVLPRFTPVAFTWALACHPNGNPGAPGSEDADTLNIINASGIRQTSVVNDGMNSTITYLDFETASKLERRRRALLVPRIIFSSSLFP